MYCSSFAELFLIVQSSLWFSEKFTTEFSAFRLVLDISGGTETGEIIMWPDHGGDNQKWYFDDDLTIRSELGFVLDVKFRSTENGATLICYPKHGDDNQKFRVVPIPKWVTNIVKTVTENIIQNLPLITLTFNLFCHYLVLSILIQYDTYC